MIHILSSETIDRIAAGEVIDRPKSVVKELVENAVDAKATAISVEIAGGGIDLIRVTDNGSGISAEDLPKAFMRHATSKISSAEDLLNIHSLGFRGEALSSISSVAKVSVTTKTKDALMGNLYRIEAGKELSCEPVGAPCGTTMVIRDLFYNTPARRKFLRSAQTETNYIADIMEHLAMSRPDISFKFKANGRDRLFTLGRNDLNQLIYQIFGRDVQAHTIELEGEFPWVKMTGVIGKPILNKASRSSENYFINGRYIKSSDITTAIEEAYKPFLMQHRFPFTAIYFEMAPELLDVNVHPSKMELRLRNREEICSNITRIISEALENANKIPRMIIPETSVKSSDEHEDNKETYIPEPYEIRGFEKKEENFLRDYTGAVKEEVIKEETEPAVFDVPDIKVVASTDEMQESIIDQKAEDTVPNKPEFKLIGQLFDTYWLAEFNDKFLMIDQHAAHEKVYYERIMKTFKEDEVTIQRIDPPLVLALTAIETDNLNAQRGVFEKLGFIIEDFGGKNICVRGVPANIYSIQIEEIIKELLAETPLKPDENISIITDRIATMSCKAAVKGNDKLSYAEAKALIGEMLTLDNPYNCPHGRPSVIEMTKIQIEKAFKRIV